MSETWDEATKAAAAVAAEHIRRQAASGNRQQSKIVIADTVFDGPVSINGDLVIKND